MRSGDDQPGMTTADQWREICDRLQREDNPLASPLLAELAALAYRDGPRVLRNRFPPSEDLVQDAIVRILTHFDSFVKATSPRQYFATTLTRLAVDQLRPKRARSEVLREDLDELPHSQPATPEATLRQAEIARAFAQLPARDAQALSASAAGADGNEVAAMLGVSRDNAFQIISRAKKHLRRLLEEEP